MRPMPYICPAFSSKRRISSMVRRAASSSSLLKEAPFEGAFCAFPGAVLPRTGEDAAAMGSPFGTAEPTKTQNSAAPGGKRALGDCSRGRGEVPPCHDPQLREPPSAKGEACKRQRQADPQISEKRDCHPLLFGAFRDNTDPIKVRFPAKVE